MASKRAVDLAVLVVLVSVGVAKGRPVRSNLGLGIGAGDGLGIGLISALVGLAQPLAQATVQVTALWAWLRLRVYLWRRLRGLRFGLWFGHVIVLGVGVGLGLRFGRCRHVYCNTRSGSNYGSSMGSS
jgi:hypothetical protein